METIQDIADAFLSKETMTHKKVQKLCYYAQAWHLVLYDETLVNERFEAWIHGPVCPSLYMDLREYSWHKIPKREMPKNIKDNEIVMDLIDEVYRVYGDLDGNDLEALTHSELPWKEAREGVEPWQGCNNIISTVTMVDFYRKELSGGEDA